MQFLNMTSDFAFKKVLIVVFIGQVGAVQIALFAAKPTGSLFRAAARTELGVVIEFFLAMWTVEHLQFPQRSTS